MKFLRQDISRHLKIGKKRRKLQKWRRPTGRHSKMRLKRKSYPAVPSVGYKSSRTESGLINGKMPVLVSNVSDLEGLSKENLVVISTKVGARKKIDIIKKANEMKLELANVKGDKK